MHFDFRVLTRGAYCWTRCPHRNRKQHLGLSLLELLAAITILGALSFLVMPRLVSHTSHAKSSNCNVNVENIEIQTALWRRDTGSWPLTNLSDIGGDISFFPDGLPVCPVDGSPYVINPSNGRIVGHNH